MALDLTLATTLFGNLDDETAAELEAYHAAPSSAGWDEIRGIVIHSPPIITVWEAVVATVPGFPAEGTLESLDHTGFPTATQLEQAILYATH